MLLPLTGDILYTVVCLYDCMHVYMNVCAYMCMGVCMHMGTRACVCVCVWVYIRVCEHKFYIYRCIVFTHV